MMRRNTLTDFGRELRYIRLTRGELLADMAERLRCSSSYISAMENGKRKVTHKFLLLLKEEYGLSEEDFKTLEDAAEKSATSISIDLKETSDDSRQLAIAFAKKFDKLDQDTIAKINKLIRR